MVLRSTSGVPRQFIAMCENSRIVVPALRECRQAGPGPGGHRWSDRRRPSSEPGGQGAIPPNGPADTPAAARGDSGGAGPRARGPTVGSNLRGAVATEADGMGGRARVGPSRYGPPRPRQPGLRRHWLADSRTREKRPRSVHFAGFARAGPIAQESCYRTLPSIAEVFPFHTVSRSTCWSKAMKLEMGGVSGTNFATGWSRRRSLRRRRLRRRRVP